MNLEVERLHGDKFLHYWPQISGELDKCPQVWSDFWTKDVIRDNTMDGSFQCWAVGTSEEIQGVVFSRVATYPTGNVFYAFLAFGEGLGEMVEALEATFEKFAKTMDCRLAVITGRPGWAPMLKRLGFKQDSVMMVRRLSSERVN